MDEVGEKQAKVGYCHPPSSPATQFKPGQSGNPSGRRNSLREQFAEWIDQENDGETPRGTAWKKLMEQVRRGNTRAIQIFFDFTMSKPPQDLNIGGQKDNPVSVYNIQNAEQKEKLERLHNSVNDI